MAEERKLISDAQERRAVEAVLNGLGGERLSNRRAAARERTSHHLAHNVRQERGYQQG